MDYIQQVFARGIADGLERLVGYGSFALLGILGAYFVGRLWVWLVRRWFYRNATRIASLPGAFISSAWSSASEATQQTSVHLTDHYTKVAIAIAPFASQTVTQVGHTASRVSAFAGEALVAATPVANALVNKTSATVETAVELARDRVAQATPVVASAATSVTAAFNKGSSILLESAIAATPNAILALEKARSTPRMRQAMFGR